MLNVLRKHASSWLIKVILAAICIVFIFFFGSSTLRSPHKKGEVLVEVGGTTITEHEVNSAIRRQKDSNPMYENLPDKFVEQFRQMVINSLIEDKLILAESNKIGLVVSDEEIFDVIKNNPGLQKDGSFNAQFYQNQYRPWYINKYGIDYEELIRESLMIDKFKKGFATSLFISDEEVKNQYQLDNTKIRLASIKIDPQSLGEDYQPQDSEITAWINNYKDSQKTQTTPEDESESLRLSAIQALKIAEGQKQADNLVETLWPLFKSGKGLEEKIKKFNLVNTEIPLTPITQAHTILPQTVSPEILAKLFSLDLKKPFMENPVNAGGTIYFFKLLEKTEPNWDEFEKVKAEEKERLTSQLSDLFYRQWLSKKMDETKINYMN